MENEKPRLESMEDRTAHLLFPSDTACVQILEILVAFPRATQDLMLAVVTANRDRGYPRVSLRGTDENAFHAHAVKMSEPLASKQRAAQRAEWRGEQPAPVDVFLKECCRTADKSLSVRSSDLYDAYAQWCKRNGAYPLHRAGFQDHLVSEGIAVSRARRIDGKQVRAFEGLALKKAGGK